MRKVMCLICALMLCLTLAVPAFAATGTFVPSITYKDGPEVEDATLDSKDVSDCIVITSIKGAEEKTTDISQEDRDLLLEVYEELEDGSMVLPLENKDYVVRELVDISFAKSECVEAEHGHKQWLAEAGNTLELVLDMGLKGTTKVEVLVYIDGQWEPIESVTNNGDGTVTCVFEDICPVAFCVDAEAEAAPPQTGDAIAQDLGLWIVLLVIAAGVMTVLLVNRRKIVG